MSIFHTILFIHICFGALSLACAAGAMFVTKGQWWHRRIGEGFFYGMTGVFVTAIPMSIMITSVFLFAIAIFSYYLAFTGWRFARNTAGDAIMIDWIASIVMLVVASGMVGGGIYFYNANTTQSTVLLVFGLLGVRLSYDNIKVFRRGGARGKERLMMHFSSMIGATIAATTAFAVTNLHVEPAIVLWLGPTAVLVPVIFWWRRKINVA